MNTDTSTATGSYLPLFWLALGTFAVGTESFMIAGLLPDMALDLHVSVVAAGQLVTVFALAYALSSPVLTALTGAIDRRRLMIGAMVMFTLANLLAGNATDYWWLMAARILLAASAGIFVPGANALAGATVIPERRGTALAIVNGGISIAVAFGVPLGAVVGAHLGWRTTFFGVAGLAAVATAGLIFGLPRAIGAKLPVATLRERLTTARRPIILMSLLVTTLWAMGAYTVYTYLALLVSHTTTLRDAEIGYVLFMWGAAAAIGVAIGGKAVDRLGPRPVILPSLFIMALAFALLSATAYWLSPAHALLPLLIGVVAWGLAHWAFFPAQQASLIGIAGLKGTPIVLSLNASFMYLGFSLGAALGALTLNAFTVSDLGWVAAVCEVGALALTLTVHNVFVRCVKPVAA